MTKETKYKKNTLYQLSISDLKPDPKQPRKYFDPEAIKELSKSIKLHGVLQPVLFRQNEKGKLVLVSGERRFKAAKKANLDTIPAMFTDGKPGEIALVENLLREDLTPVEEAEALNEMVEQHDYTHEQLAEALGRGRSTITEILTLNKLPDDIREECRSNPQCPRRILIEIAKKKTSKGMRSLYTKYKNKGLTSDEIRKTTRGPRAERAEITRKAIQILSQKLEKISQAEIWSAEERENLRPDLEHLKTIITGMLSTD